jgi:hypothetical protein
MAKGSVVKGTPFNFIPAGGAGIAPGRPQGSDSTVMPQYRGSGINTQENLRGTPYQSDAGNPGDARRVEHHDRYGRVIDPAAGDQADPAANGRGVILDKADDYAKGFQPPAAPTLDSPVPREAPIFDTTDIQREDRAHLGTHNEDGSEGLVKGGGVMSR